MDDMTKAKLAAASKIALGGGRIVSGIMTATGHGLMGVYLKKHHHTAAAFHLAKSSVEKGQRLIDDGLADWKKASQ